MRIGHVDLDDRVLVLAELGNNHEGSVERARELVCGAGRCGADGVKLQTFRTSGFVRRSDTARYERYAGYELAPDAVVELAELARSLGLLFVSTPLDLESVALLAPLVDAFKIASGDNDFFALLEAVAATRKPVLLSTGMSELRHVEAALAALGGSEVAVLQCTSAYPAPPGEVNLAAIPLLADRFGRPVGYSDHTLGTTASLAAVALGARVIEKHFTLDKEQSEFRDHALSADPPELRTIVEGVREVESLLGQPVKAVQPSERETVAAARRSIVAARDLEAGETVEAEALTWLRPADGLPPGAEGQLLGRRLLRPVAAGEPIRPEDVA